MELDTVEAQSETIVEDIVVEEYLDEYLEEVGDQEEFDELPFVDSSKVLDTKESIRNFAILDHQYTVVELAEDSTEIDVHDIKFEDEFTQYEEEVEGEIQDTIILENPKSERKISKKHKFHQLTGKAACKYCETMFKSKDALRNHACKYLQCDPKNFICRICSKELSKKTFSNHLHETLDCQYCLKAFVNPRNLKTHIKNIHKNEEFVPPKSPNRIFFKELDIVETEVRLDEETGIITEDGAEKEKKKYVRKKGRYECDLCGRVFSLARSLTQHLLLHTKTYRFVCEVSKIRYFFRMNK